MLLSRECDRRAGVYYRQGKAWFHISSAGHEGLAVLGELLEGGDFVVPHYRDRALMISRGMDVEEQARDLMGKARSHSGGRNMSSHFCYQPGNVFSIASPTGSQCLPASGIAWAARFRDESSVVLCSVGDATTRQGEFFEALAFALERDLPVLFLVSDNGYGISTPTADFVPSGLGMVPDRVMWDIDAADPDVLHDAASRAIASVRGGGGPAVLWCRLDRLDSHTSSDDQRVYRTPDELAVLRDPIEVFRSRLLREGTVTPEQLMDTETRVAEHVEEAFDRVAAEPTADPKAVHDHLFAPQTERDAACEAIGPVAARSGDTMVAAVNRALRTGLRDQPEMVVFGEDVEDPKGGVFGFTKGLGETSDGRVTNSPLAEATIVGAAVGLAAAGMRPVVELQFIDFVGPAWNQIAAQLTTLRWRTLSAWNCPVVIYAPWGGYLPGGGIWHSQSNESLFTHLPGLRVAVPSTPADAEAVFLESFEAPDPTLVLLPKNLMRRRERTDAPPSPSRGSRVLRTGSDVTLVTWGNGVDLSLAAVDALIGEGVTTDVIDLRWLVPLDRETVAASLRRTGRLVVVQEDNRTSSFGAGLLADLIQTDEEFYSLLAPPRLVTRDDIHVPFHPDLEDEVMPSVGDVAAAIHSVLR
ncbi:alpha-ketoacid dehydrogenase subunit alpha/beta [Nocardiopsis terrae]|nr:alpha-ketoacid dehydrogenase subunit alpha/beta [Nocardiopsis terrae]